MSELRPESWGYPGDQGKQRTLGGPARLIPFGGQGGWIPGHRIGVREGCLEFHLISFFMTALTLNSFHLIDDVRRSYSYGHYLLHYYTPDAYLGPNPRENHDCFREGSGGGTPHSGVPAGRWIRFGSQSSVAFALSFCRRKVNRRDRDGGVWKTLAKYSSRISNFLFRFSRPSSCSFVT